MNVTADAHNCRLQFNFVISTIHSNNTNEHLSQESYQALSSIVDDERCRFQMWFQNIGDPKHYRSKGFSDYRLVKDPKLHAQVTETLEDLTENLQDIIAHLTENESNFSCSQNTFEDDKTSLCSDLTEILLAVSDCVKNLFRISIMIHNCYPPDEFTTAPSRSRDSLAEDSDISHVKRLYPHLDTDQDRWLMHRLGRAISQRREFLRHHEDRTYIKSDYPEDEASIVKGIDDDTESEVSYTTDEEIGQTQSLRVTPLSSVSEGALSFQCPYCCKIVNIQSQNDWKRHVFHDLRPYVCTFPTCDLAIFSRQSDWFNHEMENHRSEWHCHFCAASPFTSPAFLKAHLRFHVLECSTEDFEAISCASRKPLTHIPIKNCPFCHSNTTLSKPQDILLPSPMVKPSPPNLNLFRRHVAIHMEQLALVAISGNKHDEQKDKLDSEDVLKSRDAVKYGLLLESDDLSDSEVQFREPKRQKTAQASDSKFKFYFRVTEIGQREDVPDRLNASGLWCPPQSLGENIIKVDDGTHNSYVYCFHGQDLSTFDLSTLVQYARDENIVEYRTVSLYYCQTTSRFWCIDYDATTNAVRGSMTAADSAASSDTEGDEESEIDEYDPAKDWNALSFTWDTTTGRSMLNPVGAGRPQLFATRSDQTWPLSLLPRNYQPVDFKMRKVDGGVQPPLGSLGGNLALMIALVAFTANPEGKEVHNVFLECVQGSSWSTPSDEGAGWRDKRGLVVSVYVAPGQEARAAEYEDQNLFE